MSITTRHVRPESKLESANDADDIYDLYGRDSWAGASDDYLPRVAPASIPSVKLNGSANTPSSLRDAQVELLDEEADEDDRDGSDSGLAYDRSEDDNRPPTRQSEDHSSSPANQHGPPALSYTNWEAHAPGSTSARSGAEDSFDSAYDTSYDDSYSRYASSARIDFGEPAHSASPTPSRAESPALALPLHVRGHVPNSSHQAQHAVAPHSPHGPSHLAPGQAAAGPRAESPSALLSTSSNTSRVHPSISRITAGQSRSVSTSTTSSAPAPSMTMSQASLVSLPYPGEDPEAFHVRSTYARLDVEGVWGDGWDDGIERTRGGLSASDNRMTIAFPTAGAIPEGERKFLQTLDRFGFVSSPHRTASEGRLALIPAAPLRRLPKVRNLNMTPKPQPGAGDVDLTAGGGGNKPQPRSPPADGPSESRQARLRKREALRVEKWMRMMSVGRRDTGGNVVEWRWSSREEGSKYRERIYKGIPDRWRMAAWWTLVEARARTQPARRPVSAPPAVPTTTPRPTTPATPASPHTPVSHNTPMSPLSPQSAHRSNVTLSRLSSSGHTGTELEKEYRSRRERNSEHDVQIDLDVPRTISGHVLFKTRFGHGQRALFHVLHAFSQVCPTCGYCQGMGSVAATLLCYFEEERAYALLIRMHDLYDMHGVYAPGFPGLLESFYVQERLLEALIPDVYTSFQRNMISSSAWATKIYITLFVNTVPFSTQLRIWDALFLDGYDVMVVAVIALLWSLRDLLASPHADFESIMSLLSSYYVVENDDVLLQWMRKLYWNPAIRDAMVRWRHEWRQLVAQGKSGNILL